MKSLTHLDSTHDSRKDKTWRLLRKTKIQEFRGLGEGRGSEKQSREERVLGQWHCQVPRDPSFHTVPALRMRATSLSTMGFETEA